MKNLEWYVLNYNFNAKEMENFNIFRNIGFTESVQELIDNFVTFDVFVENLERELKYAFWSKSEYEIIAKDLFDTIEKKVDIYAQIKPNIKILAQYIIDYYNNL